MSLQNGWRWCAAAVILGGAVSVSGQSAAPPGRDEVLTALLAEVKGLRAAMEQMASAGPRVQLFASRLQLQEGRMTAIARRLDTIRDRLGDAHRAYDEARTSLAGMEASAAQGSAAAIPREELEHMVAARKNEVRLAKATVDRYTAEETQLLTDLTTEQGRWIDINQRLDDLEKALGPGGR
jgi:hypothetical protein